MRLKATRIRAVPSQRRRVTAVVVVGLAVVAILLMTAGGVFVQAGVGCSVCHAMKPYADDHANAAHSGQPCAECHTSSSALAVPAEGLRLTGWMLGSLVGRVPASSHPDDGPCRSCHSEQMAATIESRGISVRHSDFSDQPCAACHSGTGHRVDGRHYRLLEMDDCMVCHKSAVNDPSSCELCHSNTAERREGDTSWRSTHGPGWESTHGMGDITGCRACHSPVYCVRCHGTRIPHPVDWAAVHGSSAVGAEGQKCVTCHEASWCADCHGIEMPHPATFLPDHEAWTSDVGEETCLGCHDENVCHACHLASSHPDVPGVGIGHAW